jgi:methyl-accepting chemotaxis protein
MSIVVRKVDANQASAVKTEESIELMAVNVQDAAQSSQGISEASHLQLDQFNQLQSTIDSLFATLRESGTKVGATAVIGEDLHAVTDRLNELMKGFSFIHSDAIIESAQNEKRRAPRARNSLLVQVRQNENMLDAVTRDFSLTGLSLWLVQPITSPQPLDLELYVPSNNLDQYTNQSPLKVKGRIAWQRQENGRHACGVEFVEVGTAIHQQLKQCFEFFNKRAEF